jgi:hypothetical protein
VRFVNAGVDNCRTVCGPSAIGGAGNNGEPNMS